MFNNETFYCFSIEFDAKIYSPKYSENFRWRIASFPHDYKIIFFYGELMKLYKYVPDIPEILTLGGLFDNRFFQKIVFIMHMINLFAEEVKNVNTYRVFILFMITKAFKSFYSNSFNPFEPARHELICNNDYHDLYFFIWKFNAQKRRDIKKRKLNPFRSEPEDFVHLKTVFLIYLYQHSIFFKYYNIGKEDVNDFKKFIDKVIEDKDCVGCLFNEYLSEIKIK
jgi:hypothetical protein